MAGILPTLSVQYGSPTWATPAHEQSTQTIATGTTVNVSFGSLPAVGSIIVVVGTEVAGTLRVTGVTDNASGGSNSYSQQVYLADATATRTIWLYWAVVERVAATTHTVTAAFGSSTQCRITIIEVSGADSILSTSSLQNASGTTHYGAAAPGHSAAAGTFSVLGLTSTLSGSLWTPSGSWVERQDLNSQFVATLASSTPLVDERGMATISSATRSSGILVTWRGVDASWVDITTDVVREATVTVKRGMDGGRPGDRVASTGTATFDLRNDAGNSGATLGYYSPDHASVRTGWALGAPLRIRLTDPTTSTVHDVFTGRVDAIDPVPGIKGPRRVRVTAVDWLDEAARWLITGIDPQVQKRADEVISAIVALMPVQPPNGTSLDTGRDSLSYALDLSEGARTPALQEFARLTASDLGYLWVTGAGGLRFENRHYRLLTSTISATLTESDEVALSLASSRDDIVNVVNVTVWPRIVDSQASTVLYEQQNPLYIANGETRTVLGPYRDPVTGEQCGGVEMQTPMAGTDFVVNTQSEGGGTDLTSSCTLTPSFGPSGVKWTITNSSGSNGYVIVLRALGKGVYAYASTTLTARDATSVTAYGERAAGIDMPYQGSADIGQAAANYLRDAYKDPSARAKLVTIAGDTTDLVTHILSREISQRVRISETVTGLSSDEFFLQGLTLRVLASGHVTATWVLAPAPAAQDYWILGTTTLGAATCIPAPF